MRSGARERLKKEKDGVPVQPPTEGHLRTLSLPLLFVGAAAARGLAAVWHAPGSDVYYFLTEAVRTLLAGSDPYLHNYTGVPAALLTPGAEKVFAYLPVVFLYSTPFYLAGDVRLGLVFADLVVGGCILAYGGRWRLAAAAVYLFAPFTILFSTVYPNVTVIAMAFLAAFLVLESRGRRVPATLCLGVALASTQFSLLLLPLVAVYYFRERRWVEPLLALGVAALFVAPFLLPSPSVFLSETLSFQFGRPVAALVGTGPPLGLTLNPSLDAISVATLGFALPFYAKVAIELTAVLLLVRVTDLSSLVRNTAVLITASAFILPNDFFWAYLELPFMLFLFWLSAPQGLEFVKEN